MNSGLREQRILTSAGAGAGLTAAFSAPVSGAIFVFEEVHKAFIRTSLCQPLWPH